MADNNYRRNGPKGNIINGMSEKGKTILQAEISIPSRDLFNLFFFFFLVCVRACVRARLSVFPENQNSR
jgi:hypothetical protein